MSVCKGEVRGRSYLEVRWGECAREGGEREGVSVCVGEVSNVMLLHNNIQCCFAVDCIIGEDY